MNNENFYQLLLVFLKLRKLNIDKSETIKNTLFLDSNVHNWLIIYLTLTNQISTKNCITNNWIKYIDFVTSHGVKYEDDNIININNQKYKRQLTGSCDTCEIPLIFNDLGFDYCLPCSIKGCFKKYIDETVITVDETVFNIDENLYNF